MKTNFIFFSLCDNDFDSLLRAVEYVFNEKETELTEEDYKHFVINYMVWYCSFNRVHPLLKVTDEYLAHIKQYLQKSLKVQFLQNPPDVDHDYGSVVLDINTRKAYRI
jgi:hypothetical protein